MNPTRPAALPVTWKRRTGLLYLSILLASATLHATPKAAKKTAPQPSPSIAPAPGGGGPSVTAKDLQITADDDRKAEAMARFIEGNIAEDNADLDKALEDYRKVLEVDPDAKIRPDDDSDTLTLLAAKVGFELARRGDVAGGIDVLKDTVKAAPKEAMAYYYLSQLYSKYLKKYDVALKYAQQAMELDPQNFVFYVANYELQINLGQSKKAVEILDRAAGLKNNDPQFWLKMSELYIHALVKEDGSSTPDDLKKMNTLFQKALALAKNDPAVNAKVGDFYVLTKQIKEAIPLYEKVLAASGDSVDPAISAVREKLASCYVVAGQKDDAIKALEALIKKDPMRASTYETLGQLYAEKGDFDKALNSYQQNLLLNPNQPMNYLRVSDMMFQLKKFDKAVAMLAETHQKFPDLPRITYALGQALSLAKKHQEAMTVFEEAKTEAENSQSEMLDGEFYFDYGAAAEQAGLIQKAADLFKKSISLDPSNAARAYNYLGFMWVDRGQNLEEAGSLIKRAVEMEPGNGAYIDSLGWYYFKKGEPEKALPELLKAAEAIKPEDFEVYDHIGDTYQKLGNTAQALVNWQKAVTLDPDNKSLADKVEGAKQKVTSAVTPAASPGVKAERQ